MQQTDKRVGKLPDAYHLSVPVDASGIQDFKPEQNVKVIAVQHTGKVLGSQIIKLDEKGNGGASFRFEERPGDLRIIIGPEAATDDELQGLQTLVVKVSARQWPKDLMTLHLHPIAISPYYWWWWFRWCRTFTVRGRVLCPDGKPVPGATVCAYDIDGWWWWISKQLVGCDTTDINGTFEIKFRWCCGWWPWWWWKSRNWEFAPILAERILPTLKRDQRFSHLPPPNPTPNTEIFEQLLGDEDFSVMNISSRELSSLKRSVSEGTQDEKLAEKSRLTGMPTGDMSLKSRLSVGPDFLGNIRENLLKRVPAVAEIRNLRIWPWWPWHPWQDCTPDIIFKVTQDCKEKGSVIVEETIFDTRWDIPTTLDVTLTANDKACCAADEESDPEGTCVVLTDVCNDPIFTIGGNLGAQPTPPGYFNPGGAVPPGGIVSSDTDRPYGGAVVIQGQVGSDVDYYEFEWSDDGVTWNDMPASSVGDIPRQFVYFTGITPNYITVPFLHTISGRRVYESRLHYEASPAWTGIPQPKFWMASNYLSLMYWDTLQPFLNGLYRIRMKGWQEVGGNLVNPQILPVCSTQLINSLILQIDNRLVGPGSGHPAFTTAHPCGAGTVHTCTPEPDTNVLAIRILHNNGTSTVVNACDSGVINATDRLQIDFFAHDPEGHLSSYSLNVTYGINQIKNLLALPGRTLTPLGGGFEPAAAQVGPNYAAARAQGAASPVWKGGAIRYEVLASEAFPVSCCYQLELRTHKRTIVDCSHSVWGHTNYSEYSFHISV